MNEILQQRIEEAARHYLLNEHRSPLNEILHQCDLKTEMQYHRDIEQAYIEGSKGALQNQWISVEEALPEVSEHYSYDTLSDHVFATDESLENVIVAWYDNGTKKWYQEWTGGEIVQFKITHWMPIPELPEKGVEK